MILAPHPESANPLALEVLARLPLAEAFYSLWRFLADEQNLQPLFDMHRGPSHQQQLTFTELVQVIADALTRSQGSGRKAIRDALQAQQLSTQQRAVYGKLGRVPLPLAEALLADLTARLRPLFPPAPRHTEGPDSLADLSLVIVDGKKIKRVAKRLLETRGRPGKLFGGKLLAAYLPAEGVVVAMAADPDGEANDIRLVPRLLPQVRAAVPGPRLWIADRQFCDLDQPGRFAEDGDHYLIRFSLKTSFHPDPQGPSRGGTDTLGRTCREEWGWMGAATQGDRRRWVRRLWLDRPGAEPVILVTDLLDAERYPATDLLKLYQRRWQIETVFQKITEVFGLRHLIGSQPRATVFQAALCLAIYNVLEAFRSYVAATRSEPLPPARLSLAKLFGDLHEELVGLHRVLSVAEITACFAEPRAMEALRAHLQDVLGGAWSADWLKAVPKTPRVYPPKSQAKQSGAHTSVYKILQEACTLKPTKASTQGDP